MSYNYQSQYTALYLQRQSCARYSGADWGFRPDGSEDFSLALWFWPDNPNARLLDGEGVFTLDLMDDHLVFWLKGYSDLICYADRYPLLRHEWNHITITYSSAGQVFFYINGMQTQVYSVFQKTPAETWGDILFCPGMEGYLRSVQFFAKQLSESEVDQVKRAVDGGPVPTRWFDFEIAVPRERVSGTTLSLENGAQPYALADGLFCDNGEGFFPLDGDTVNPAAHQDAPYTVQAWISIYDKDQTFAVLFMNGRHTQDCGMVLYLERDADGYHLCAGRGAHTHQENILRSSHIIPTRSWHNVAVTYDGENMRIYIDGTLEGKTTQLVPFTEHMEYGQLRIGTDDLPGLSGSEGSFHGAFGNIAVFDRALSLVELEQYAAASPVYGTEGLTANYVFSRYTCCNVVNGYEVSTAGVDTSKICRNPLTQDLPQAVALKESVLAAIPHLNGKTAADLRQAWITALPDAEGVLCAADAATICGGFRSDIEAYLASLCSSREDKPFYHCERAEDGEYYFYFVTDQIYPAGKLTLGGRSEFTIWLIRLLSTLIVDVFSIYCAVPSSVSAHIPQALQSSILNERANQLYLSIKETGLKELTSTLVKFLLSGGLLEQVIEQLRKERIWLVGANLATMATSFLVKAGTAWGWITVVIRVVFLIVDLVSIYQDMPRLLGADLLQLHFQAGGCFVDASHTPGAPRSPHWKDGQYPIVASPIVCCLRQSKQVLLVTAQFAVYIDGFYNITTSAEPEFPLGRIQEDAVYLQAGKDGTCTVQLSFTDGCLDSSGIGDFNSVLQWTIKGGQTTVAQRTTLRLFLIYDIPQAPWGEKSGFGTPWTGALETACKMTKGRRESSDTQWHPTLVEAMIQGLWNHCLGYRKTSAYVSGSGLHLTRWLADIQSGSPQLNENDCAALLVALCNLLGCDLSSILLCNQKNNLPLQTRELVAIGGGQAAKRQLLFHETVRILLGTISYYSDPCYQMPGENQQMQNPIMRPFRTEGDEIGFCEMFLEDPGCCVISSDQRSISNGRRTIL